MEISLSSSSSTLLPAVKNTAQPCILKLPGGATSLPFAEPQLTPGVLNSVSELVKGIVSQFTGIIQQLVTALIAKQDQNTTSSNGSQGGTTTTGTTPSTPTTGTKKLFNITETLWKPVSSVDGKAAVLLPSNVTGKLQKVELVDKNGKVIEKGKIMNVGVHESGRESIRFSRPGGHYAAGLMIRVTLQDGSMQNVAVKYPSRRQGK